MRPVHPKMDACTEDQTGFGEVRRLPAYDDHEITPTSKFQVSAFSANETVE